MGTLEELTSSTPGVKLELGQSIVGTITGTSSQQSNDFDTQQPAFWDDGKPKMLAVFQLHVDGEEADKAVYVQWWGSQKHNLQKGIGAFKATAGRGPQVGDRMRVQYVRDETQADRDERGVKRTPPIPAKLYRYDFQQGVPVEVRQEAAGDPYANEMPF